jgi:hypothetical protein
MYGGLESYHAMCRFYSGYVITSRPSCTSALLTRLQFLLQAPSACEVRVVLAPRARDQVFL